MRIVHLVTWASEDGSYGGPLAVAAEQCRVLAAAGEDVRLVAGGDFSLASVGETPVTVKRAWRLGSGFALTLSPGVWLLAMRLDKSTVAHVHLGRDLVSLVAAALLTLRGLKVVVQTHGMIRPDSRTSARLVDRLMTKPVLRRARRWLVLDSRESQELGEIVQPRPEQELRAFNAIQLRPSLEPRIVQPRRVTFLARLHPRKGALAFARAAKAMLDAGDEAVFDLWGPDEGDLPELLEIIDSSPVRRIEYRGTVAPGHAPDVLEESSVYVLPSHGEVFPVTVLEAIASGCAVVGPEDSPMLVELHRRGGVLVTNGEPIDIESKVRKILEDEALRTRLVANARAAVEELWSEQALVELLEGAYR